MSDLEQKFPNLSKFINKDEEVVISIIVDTYEDGYPIFNNTYCIYNGNNNFTVKTSDFENLIGVSSKLDILSSSVIKSLYKIGKPAKWFKKQDGKYVEYKVNHGDKVSCLTFCYVKRNGKRLCLAKLCKGFELKTKILTDNINERYDKYKSKSKLSDILYKDEIVKISIIFGKNELNFCKFLECITKFDGIENFTIVDLNLDDLDDLDENKEDLKKIVGFSDNMETIFKLFADSLLEANIIKKIEKIEKIDIWKQTSVFREGKHKSLYDLPKIF